ncbi:uncharacterized protein C2845_PM03G36270 [Panicum miliaceum]|uniref:Uncharacterized protein n=1 Tax=Panicum miliaceum TaxID=4540 RepID=A0A3L6T6W8_PANMI|nr:uncharacterized protein C2845_PM03G36270 [Panicum miliaceum]
MGNSYSGGGGSPAAAGAALEVPLHLCFFLLVLLLFLGFSWYTSYESAAESFANQARILLMASPFALLLAVRLLSGASAGEGRGVGDLLAVPMPERDSIHRAGGSPWGVGLMLLLLLVMVSYQSNFREKWFPLATR